MICIAGKNDIATNVLEFVTARFGVTEVVAVANRDDTGKPNWQHSLIATAQRLGVRLVSLTEAYEIPNLHFFSVEFDRIVVPKRFRQAEIYNIHFSLLPRYKGVYTAIWPLLNGEIETGVTLHRMEAGIDTGAIITQVALPISLHDTARDIYHSCLKLGYEVLREFIPILVEQPAVGIPQPMAQSTYYGPKSIDFTNLYINLRQTAFQIHNTVRAFTFQEYQLPLVLDYRVRTSQPTTEPSTMAPGTLIREDKTTFVISTIDFDLELTKDFSLELLAAVREGNATAVQRLVPLVSDLSIRTRQGWTPLMMAAYTHNLPISTCLLEAGADVNAATKKGTTVLMYAKTAAAQHNRLDLLQLLLEYGADARAIDNTGQSVLDYAQFEGNSQVISLLKKQLSTK